MRMRVELRIYGVLEFDRKSTLDVNNSIPVLPRSARIARAWSELRQNKLRHSVAYKTTRKCARQMGPFPVDGHIL